MELEKYTKQGKLDITDIICEYLNTTDKNQIIDTETQNYLIYIDFDTDDNRVFETHQGQHDIKSGYFDVYFNEITVTHKETEKQIANYFDLETINSQNN